MRCLPVLLLGVAMVTTGQCQEADSVGKAAQAYRKGGQAVIPVNDTTIIAEAEEFQVTKPGWEAKAFGTNYYAATFANSFLSRQAYLGAPEQCDMTTATIDVLVPKAGRYLALVRYEAAHRFETQFTLQVEQAGKVKLDRLYGALANVKIWAFGKKLQKTVAWEWGAGENVVWEGHDAMVELEAGTAKLTLLAGKQPGDAARRNVDLVMLTSDAAQVKQRIDKEQYLPLDGMLTQAGDVYLKVHNAKEAGPLTLTVPNGTEHSPYWVHQRAWKPVTIKAEPGQSTDWVEVGSLLDTLSDGQWNLTAASKDKVLFELEVGVRAADGKIASIRKLEKLTGNPALTYFGAMRYRKELRDDVDVLFDLADYLKKHPVRGAAPKRTLVYGHTFDPKPGNALYTDLLHIFIKDMGATALVHNLDDAIAKDGGLRRGYIDVRGVPTPRLEEHCKKLQADGKADKIAVVSLGDEIGLAKPPATDHAGFRAWLKGRGVKPADVDPAVGDDYEKLTYSPGADAAKTKPGLYYWSQLYAYRFGIGQLRERTDILKKHLPNAGIGANFSPHHGAMYMGTTHQWISLFREDGMTMPWGEDYIFQVPMASQQVNSLMVDMYRAAIKDRPERKIHFYVMPHTPNNTVNSWRRQFYGDLAHGVKIFNLFEFRPVQAAYTENHCSDPAMFQEVRKSLHELGQFEDIVQDGKVRPASAALWFSEAADVWNDNAAPYDSAKRCLYLMVRQQQIPLDVVVEGDDLAAYQVLYLTDRHVSRAAAKAIAVWVNNGGQLVATAGAGLLDELNQPNAVLCELLGIETQASEESREVIHFEKQDLAFAEPLDRVKMNGAKAWTAPVFGARTPFAVKDAAQTVGTFEGGSPAVSVRKVGKGTARYLGFLPGLSYFQPALPKRPWDRGATDDSMTHFLPVAMDRNVAGLVNLVEKKPVVCSIELVETTVVEAKSGTMIPLINWNGKPVKGLEVTVSVPVPGKGVTLASGRPVKVTQDKDRTVFTLDLDVADALILR